ncbi:MAG: type II/IV secretion system protein [Gemmatimonadetes bacterium]|nr:type II/IV secretion system protein [Gemmatimonadota bacterium]
MAYHGDLQRDVEEHLAIVFGRPLHKEYCELDTLQRAIAASFDGTEVKRSLGSENESDESDGSTSVADARDLALQPPVIRLVNTTIRDAVRARASDVHFEATPSGLSVRIRVDGVLHALSPPDRQMQPAIVSRFRQLLADLNIAEQRRPQDGRLRIRLNEAELDIRVSTVPTLHGESVVLRLLRTDTGAATLDSLGLPRQTQDVLADLVSRSHGLLIATGPTGCGKTTTLHALLSCRATGREKVITVEDPVEYQVPGVTQVPVIAAAGMTFASALRGILRQDPDVVMVGEMRDRETAAIAAQAAMTGHLVLSTLHTNDALSAVARLQDLGVEPFLVASTLIGVLAQRLVRVLCTTCRQRGSGTVLVPAAPEAGWLDVSPFYSARGCDECRGSGYRGRTGIYELLPITSAMRELLARSAAPHELKHLTEVEGMQRIQLDAAAKVAAGITSADEVRRVLGGGSA